MKLNIQGGLDMSNDTGVFLAKYFDKDSGIYIDVGANHPIRSNNTWSFNQRGWHGILIEPLPSMAKKLRQTRPRDIVIEKAISSEKGKKTLYVFRSVNFDHSSLEEDWDPKDILVKTIEVETITLTDLLKEYPKIEKNCDFIDIDVEGHEKSVLEGIDFNRFQPHMLVIEKTTKTKPSLQWEYMILDDYEFVQKVGANKIYRKKGEEL